MTDKLPFTVVKAFLLRVSFAAKSDDSNAMAFLHLQDDGDLHKYRVAVPAPFATEMAKRLAEDDFGGFEDEPNLFVSFAPTTGAGERQPDIEQLLAVWEASAFMVDFANDTHTCAVCDHVLPGHDLFACALPNERCDDECPGWTLREARRPQP